jgi:DNA methyltransferase 1-associated protein 1
VIHDRYDFSKSTTRTITDLRDRYYTILKRVKTARGEACEHGFDKNREIERKRNLEVLYSRTPEQAQEEEALYFELRKREVTEARWQKEREGIMETLGNHEIPPKESVKEKKKAGRKSMDQRRKEGLEEGGEKSRPPRNPYGVYFRSHKAVAVYLLFLILKAKVQIQTKLSAALAELAIPERPKMPTETVMKKNDELRTGLITLLELKRQLDRLDHDIKVSFGSPLCVRL